MGYYVRAFCTASRSPRLADVQEWLRKRGSRAVLDSADHAVEASRGGTMPSPVLDLDTPDWEQIAITYKAGKLPILAQINRERDDRGVLREEIAEFSKLLSDAAPEAARMRVLAHLRATTFIVACQLPTSDIDDDGYRANGDFLEYFVQHCGGLMQADGEGFYEGVRVILPLA